MREEAIQFLSNMSIFATTTFIPIIALSVNADPFMTAMIIVAYNLAVFVSNYACGRGADIYGRRAFLLVGLFLSAVAFAAHMLMKDLVSFTVVRILTGLAIGMWGPALLAYVFEAKKKLGKIMGFGGLGWGTGIFITGMLAIYWDSEALYERMYLLSTVGMFISFGIAVSLPRLKEVKLKIPLFPIDVIKKSYPAYLALVIRHTGATGVWALLPLYLKTELGMSATDISYIYASNAFIQFIVMYYADRLPSKTTITLGLIISVGSFFFFPWALTVWAWTVLFIIIGGAWSLLYVGSTVYVMERNVERATSTGLLQGSTSLAGITGPLIAGVLAQVGPFVYNFYLATILCVVALVIFLATARPPTEKERKAASIETGPQPAMPPGTGPGN
jgi:DHA1 family multidrug resistance protein-like MFS transporter